MHPQITDFLLMLRREVWEKRRLFVVVYLITSMAFLVVGWNWPKVYTSSTTIFVSEQNILQPLMQGTAVTTNAVDRAKLAREVVFSRTAMEEVMLESGWITEDTPAMERERLKSSIEGRTKIQNVSENVLTISYSDQDPERAFKTAKALTQVFIDRSRAAKQEESREAFEFIDSQVKEFHAKLENAEQALKEFHSKNVDARPGTQSEVNQRIVQLRRQMEATQLEIRELKIKRETLRKQLSGEAAVTERLTKTGQYRERLADLKEQLADLRLSYRDKHPDIVQIKTQIETLEKAIQEEKRREENPEFAGGGVSDSASTSLLYQQLRSDFSETETKLASLNARLDELGQMLQTEEDRIVRINEVEAKLSELTRDYDVNQSVYQDLLRQRENARISMNIDRENQGMTFKIQEPAALPLYPTGIRFAHFLAAGFVSSFLLPLGLIYAWVFVDQKVRTPRTISTDIGLPILASVYQVNKPKVFSLRSVRTYLLIGVILLSWAVYIYAAWLRVTG